MSSRPSWLSLATARGTSAKSRVSYPTKSCPLTDKGLVQLLSSAFDNVTALHANIEPLTAVRLPSPHLPSMLVEEDPMRPLAYCFPVGHMSACRRFFGRILWLCETKIDLGCQQDIFDSGLSDALSKVTCDRMQGSKYRLCHVMGDEASTNV
jgi:hypothetical protein